MNLARVIGNVWATRKLDELTGKKLLILEPVDDQLRSVGKPLVAVDTHGAGAGEIVAYVTAREAVLAATGDIDHMTPCDAAVVGIVDQIRERMV